MKFLETLISQLSGFFGAKHFEGVETEAEISAKLEEFKPLSEMIAGVATLQESITAIQSKVDIVENTYSTSIQTLENRVKEIEQAFAIENKNLSDQLVEANKNINELANAHLKISTTVKGVGTVVGVLEDPKVENKNRLEYHPSVN